MSNIDDLKKKELVSLQAEEVNLEDLIILGADKKIPIQVEYHTFDDKHVKARVLVKQLTMKELKNFNITTTDIQDILKILKKTMFKNNGEPFTPDELLLIPIGALKAILSKIFELSGIDANTTNLRDF